MMKKLCLENNENTNKIIITGDIDSIFQNRRASRYLKDNIAFIREDNKLIVSSEGDINKIIDGVRKVCEYINDSLEFSDNVSEAVYQYEVEEKRFDEFSEKAREIRNNDCNVDEFKAFTDSVSKYLANRSLYPLQLLSAYHLAFAQNACNFSVPGAGKTSIVYGAFAYLSHLDCKDDKYVKNLVIIAPLSAFGPWELEYRECFGRIPTVKRLSGQINIEEKKQYLYSTNPADITLLSYQSVSSLREELTYFLRMNKTMVVLDEAHRIKNTSGGVWASGVLEIAKYASARVILTGTPAPNGYEDLYNLYKFIWPTKKIIPYEVYQLKDITKHEEDPRVGSLIHSIEPFFIRIKKSDLNIPNATENPPIHVKMGEIQRRIYDAIEKRYMSEIVNSKDSVFQQELVKARLVRLIQAATNPQLLMKPLRDFAGDIEFNPESVPEDMSLISDVMSYSKNETPTKFIKAAELIEKIISKGEKVVVWAVFIDTIEAFQKYLDNKGIKSKILYGKTPVKSDDDTEDENMVETREKIIEVFNSPESSFNVVIANPFAVAESISLHKACHNAIYMERTFNAAHFIQSKDRIHRYGLKIGAETNYYYLVADDSIDETIDSRLIVKEARLNEIMESMPIPLFSNIELETGDNDIKALIREYVNRTKKM